MMRKRNFFTFLFLIDLLLYPKHKLHSLNNINDPKKCIDESSQLPEHNDGHLASVVAGTPEQKISRQADGFLAAIGKAEFSTSFLYTYDPTFEFHFVYLRVFFLKIVYRHLYALGYQIMVNPGAC